MAENDVDWNEFWDEHIRTCELMNDTKDRAFNLDKYSFGAYCCTLIDEYCEVHSLNAIEISQWLADNVKIMHEKNGDSDVFMF